jgi:hypothetical protein
MQSDPPAGAAALGELARQLGWQIEDPAEAARIVAGAANAVRAVAAMAPDSLFDTEPGSFLATLESLAGVQPTLDASNAD